MEGKMPLMYQLDEWRGTEFCAGAKAPEDVSRIMRDLGFRSVNLRRFSPKNRFLQMLARVHWAAMSIVKGLLIKRRSIVFLQYPRIFLWSRIGMWFIKWLHDFRGVKFIVLIHDINELRGVADARDWQDLWDVVNLASVVIVHNHNMRDWYVSKGVPESKLVELEIFDYLAEGLEPIQEVPYQRCVTLASNLNVEWGRGTFLAHLKDVRDVQFELYGPNYQEEIVGGENIHYHGCFASDEAPTHLVKGFGLAWGGDSIETCGGVWGRYFKYISPHRLSAYLASGLPVVVWNLSGQADFVKENGVGIVVSSLFEIHDCLGMISEEKYVEYRTNAISVSRKLRDGYYLKKAVHESIRRILVAH